jgi:hypothetical protein
MADTRIQIEVEDWVRRNWMPSQYETNFFRERLSPFGPVASLTLTQ